MPTRILLADDHSLFREGLRALLRRHRDFTVIGEAKDGDEAVRLAQHCKSDIVLMDIGMPQMNGIEATSHIRQCSPNTRILALTTRSDKTSVTSMLRAGAVGYVLKECGINDLVNAVREVVAGRGYISPKVVPHILEDYYTPHVTAANECELNTMEVEVLRHISNGVVVSDIARRLNVSSKTIERCRCRIMEKLNLKSIAEMTKYALKKGFVLLG